MIIEGNTVTESWLKVLNELVTQKKTELSTLIVRINNTDAVHTYKEQVEKDLNHFLSSINEPMIESTAGTIFPYSLSRGSISVFDRFDKVWKYVKVDKKNKRGTYFRRLTAYGDAYGRKTNQLQHIIDTYNGVVGRKPIHRRSALIATTFDPTLDHISAPYLGFPCLQQVCFLPNPTKNELSMNAIYAMQYLDIRAYGNFLGLMRLGQFMAKEMKLNFSHLHCMISVTKLDKMKKPQASDFIKKYT